MSHLTDSELILNPDGSIYHLNLRPEQIVENIITVGDQNRVAEVSKYFDVLDYKIEKREFVTHIGRLGNKKLMVISTGIGTDNIDIVINELDALANIDFDRRKLKPDFKQLNFIRIGTSGCLLEKLPVDSFLVSQYAIGLDNLMHFYEYDKGMANLPEALIKSLPVIPYLTQANEVLLDQLGKNLQKGTTLTCPGFYAPQGRKLRGKNLNKNYITLLQNNEIEGLKISNMEMETSGIYGMSSLLGHRAISFSALLANRITGAFSAKPKQTVEQLIKLVLQRISAATVL